MLPQRFTLTGQQSTIALTATFRQMWSLTRLAPDERHAVVQALILLGNSHQHPMLGIADVPYEPAGGEMMVPVPDLTVTWLPHWTNPDLPVLCTIATGRSTP